MSTYEHKKGRKHYTSTQPLFMLPCIFQWLLNTVHWRDIWHVLEE